MTHTANVPLRLEDGNNSAQFVSSPPIIAIEEGNQLSFALWDRKIEGTGLASVLLSEGADTWLEFAKNFESFVGRAIIHHQDFGVSHREILFDNAHNRLFDKLFMIVSVNQHT